MPEPMVFVSHFKIKEGKLDAFTHLAGEVSTTLESDKPRTTAFLIYIDDAGQESTFVHVFADADAMDAHVQGADERSQAAYEVMDPTGWEIYGKPSADVVEMFQQGATASGLSLVLQREHVGGFLRVDSAY